MHALYLPRLGQTMTHGTFTKWLVDPGVPFEIGTLLFEIETDKQSIEVDARLPGTLVRAITGGDEELPVGALLAVVADPGEAPSESEIDAFLATAPHSDALGDDETSADSVSTEQAPGSPPELRATAARRSGTTGLRAVPRARVLAAKHGVQLSDIQGTGPRGTITPADVEAYLSHASPQTDSGSYAGESPVRERRRVTGVARSMAENVTRSWTDVPQFVQTFLFDAESLRRRREGARGGGDRVSYTDLVVHDVARAAVAVPEANATWRDGEILLYEDVNVAVAIDSPRGLVLPVIRAAQRSSPAEIGSVLRGLTEKATTGLTPAETLGSTITVSNLGMQGVETGVPLINAPHAATVFVGNIATRPYVIAEQVVARATCYISIAYDHRVLDGATAGRFTTALRSFLEADDESND